MCIRKKGWAQGLSLEVPHKLIQMIQKMHNFVGFNEFPSLVYWNIVIHHHQPQGPTLFGRVRWDFTCLQCNVCTDMGPPALSHIQEDYN